ncbi:DNA-binding transcriptional LysR family regulator [Shimia isoporae]|uniref:DNA-binding transcriptional LysR family regulator n=1 Tax=Shimia isoporae TaxID=647720 RepID=A0A4R1NTF9_9RHOB|nr:LysR family transcriptional regulator [Shimia isoporae]TCL08262.1 DNA-binding transcriptional LysR family regulator [Shimia isoporae]
MFINPKHLVQFVEVVECGSLTEAATKLGLTQPALSRNMKELEAQMGIPLLLRGKTGVTLTELGMRAFPYAQSIHTTLGRLSSEAETWDKGQVGKLRIGAGPFPASILPKILSDFLEHRPGVFASLEVGGVLALSKKLQNGELDLVVGPTGLESSATGITARKLFSGRLALFAAPTHAIARKKKITAEDLSSSRWLGTPPDSVMRRQVRANHIALGMPRVNFNIEISSIESAVDVLQVGDHLAIMPEPPMRRAVAEGKVMELPVKLPIAQWPIVISHPELSILPPQVMDFIDALEAAFRDEKTADPSQARD